MFKFFNSVRKKFSDRKGESIGEVLVALLISSVALVMLASMITSSSSLITSSEEKMEKYYQNSAVLTGEGTAAFSGKVKLVSDSDPTTPIASFDVDYFVNDSIKRNVVISFEKQ